MSSEPFRPRLNLLTAYPYTTENTTRHVAEMGDDIRWLLDSGAFTAYKLGRVITLDEYCAFLDGLPVKPWRYFALDVIGDPVATERNYQLMLDRGYNPIPIFTRGGSLDELDRLFERTDYVGLGGVAGADQSAYQWLRAVMDHAAGRHVHILGFASMNWLKHLRPFSCDASSFEAVARYGQLAVYVGRGTFAAYKRSDAQAPPSPAVVRGLRRIGVDAYQLQRDESWRGGDSLVRWASAATWIAASVDIERVLGTRLFLALAADRTDMLRCGFEAAVRGTDFEPTRRAIRARQQQRAAA